MFWLRNKKKNYTLLSTVLLISMLLSGTLGLIKLYKLSFIPYLKEISLPIFTLKFIIITCIHIGPVDLSNFFQRKIANTLKYFLIHQF